MPLASLGDNKLPATSNVLLDQFGFHASGELAASRLRTSVATPVADSLQLQRHQLSHMTVGFSSTAARSQVTSGTTCPSAGRSAAPFARCL